MRFAEFLLDGIHVAWIALVVLALPMEWEQKRVRRSRPGFNLSSLQAYALEPEKFLHL